MYAMEQWVKQGCAQTFRRVMGDCYRDALKANKAKPWPFGSGRKGAPQVTVREESIRRFNVRHAPGGHYKRAAKAQAREVRLNG